MIERLKNLLTSIFINHKAEKERDRKTQRVHERAKKAMDEAEGLIESYRATDEIIRKHRKVWKNTHV